MTNYQKLLNTLEELQLHQFRANLDSMIDTVNQHQKTFIDALYELTQIEMVAKDQRAINACVKVAGFPFLKTINDFDFAYQPSLNKTHIQDLSTCRFLERKENIIFIGTPGVGKTHLATAIGIEAASARKITT